MSSPRHVLRRLRWSGPRSRLCSALPRAAAPSGVLALVAPRLENPWKIHGKWMNILKWMYHGANPPPFFFLRTPLIYLGGEMNTSKVTVYCELVELIKHTIIMYYIFCIQLYPHTPQSHQQSCCFQQKLCFKTVRCPTLVYSNVFLGRMMINDALEASSAWVYQSNANLVGGLEHEFYFPQQLG